LQPFEERHKPDADRLIGTWLVLSAGGCRVAGANEGQTTDCVDRWSTSGGACGAVDSVHAGTNLISQISQTGNQQPELVNLFVLRAFCLAAALIMAHTYVYMQMD